jgi:hypothetical protein
LNKCIKIKTESAVLYLFLKPNWASVKTFFTFTFFKLSFSKTVNSFAKQLVIAMPLQLFRSDWFPFLYIGIITPVDRARGNLPELKILLKNKFRGLTKRGAAALKYYQLKAIYLTLTCLLLLKFRHQILASPTTHYYHDDLNQYENPSNSVQIIYLHTEHPRP